MTDQAGPGLEEQRVFAAVARRMLGEAAAPPSIGRFEIRARLGAGAMGEVFACWDPRDEREVAVKVLAMGAQHDADAKARLEREARALGRTRHANIVQIHEVGEAEGRLYIAMERLLGRTLHTHIVESAPLAPAQVDAVLGMVCDAIEHAHAHGLVHRDLKPANIFLCDNDDGPPLVKVLDFGIAKGVSSATLGGSTASGTVMGTPLYMSPEQARDSSKVDAHADLWAVAIIAFECLVGELPLRADNFPDLAVALLTQPLPIPSTKGSVPCGFDVWFARATAANTGDRFASARALRTSLAEALAGPGHRTAAPTTTVASPDAVATRGDSHRWAWIALGAGVLGTVLTLALALDAGGPARAESSPAHVVPTTDKARKHDVPEDPRPNPSPNPSPDSSVVAPPPVVPPLEPTRVSPPAPPPARADPVDDLEF